MYRSLLTATAITLLLVAKSVVAVTDAEFNELKSRFDSLADSLENQASPSSTHVGGYGELHYNNLEDGSGKKSRSIDFHRFVLFFGHEFNDRTRFVSELELEHALVKDTDAGGGTPSTSPGEIELEQAYLEFDLNDTMTIRGGVFLIPVGIINETHEPPVFYGVERNPVEKSIIPATWWEAGAALSGQIGDQGLSYDVALTSGLDGGNSIRGGRQKVAKATANDLAVTGRIKYTGMPGLEIAATANLQNSMSQGNNPDDNAVLLETHAIYNIGPVNLRALYARWDLDGTVASVAQKDSQDGYYIEASWKFRPKHGVFARYNVWNNGGAVDTEMTQLDVGVNFWPHEDVVIKIDIQQQDHGSAIGQSKDKDGFNLGIGYQF